MKLFCEFVDADHQIAIAVEFSDGKREVILRFFTPQWILDRNKQLRG